MTSETEETVLDLALAEAREAVAFLDKVRAATDDEKMAVGQDHWNRAEAALRGLAALSRAPEAEEPCWRCNGEGCIQEGSPEAWNYADCPDCGGKPFRSPPSTGGEGEDWDRIPRAKRFGRRLDESAVKHLAPGTLLRFYSEDPWFDPSPSSPANGDIVVFTGEVSNTFPKVGPHLEVQTLGGRVYPGGGWVYQIFQFVADPSPEMGEISREELAGIVRQLSRGRCEVVAYHKVYAVSVPGSEEIADAILSKLKENGLSREGLGGSAQSQPGSDAQERSPVPPLSDGGRV